jgi:transcriptional regulator with XRE-family HTH domain
MDELARNIHIPIPVPTNSPKAYLTKTITSATVSNIENDKNNPSADIIIALSDFFNVSTDWILKGKEFVKKERHIELTEELYASSFSPPLVFREIQEQIAKMQSDLIKFSSVVEDAIDNSSKTINNTAVTLLENTASKEINDDALKASHDKNYEDEQNSR